MRSIFSLDSPVVAFLTKIANMAILSLLWTIFSIPIVTIGAATTALYSVQIRLLQDMDDAIIQNFWKSFRRDFGQSTVLFFILIPLMGIAILNILFVFGMIPGFPLLLRIGVGIVTALLLVCIGYVFPLTAQFKNTIKGTLKNSAFFMLRYLPQGLCALLLGVMPFAVMYFLNLDVIQAMVYYTCFVVAFVANIKMRIFRKLFMKYIPVES